MNTRSRELSVILIAARHTLSKRYYAEKYTTGSLEAPDCSSRDSVTPDVADPIHHNCTHCPKNQWGSRITEAGKEGKACSDYKRVVLWPVELSEDPLVLDIAATSLKAPKGQKHTVLMFGDYMTQLAKHGMDPTQVVTKVSFTDAEYPQLSFTFERYVDEDEWLRVQELRESDDVNTCIDEELFETEGEVEDAEPPKTEKPKTTRTRKPKAEPEPEPEPEDDTPEFPGVATIMKDGDNLIIAQDEDSWREAWAEGFRPQATGQMKKETKAEPETKPKTTRTRKPKAEPKPEPEADDDGDEGEAPGSSDLLAEVAALLGKK